MFRIVRFTLLALLASIVAGLLSAAAAPTASSASSPTTFSGQATVLSGTVEGIDLATLCFLAPPADNRPCRGVVDTGPIPVGGTEANYESSLLCYAYPQANGCALNPPDLTGQTFGAQVLHAAVVARGDTSRAEASVAKFSLNVAGQTIGADILDARARATCTPNGPVVQAGAETNVTINGTKYQVGPSETLTVPLLGALGVNIGYVVINEGATAQKSGSSIDASALHVVINDPVTGKTTDLYVSRVHADVTCGTSLNCPANHQFVTGGGFIAPLGDKLNFAVAGRNGEYWGHVIWQPTKLHVKNPYTIGFWGNVPLANVISDLKKNHSTDLAKAIADLSNLGNPNIEGGALLAWDLPNQPGQIAGEALALDLGEPGNLPKGHDYFEIAGVGDPSVPAAGDFLSGGNIQMHGKCPS
jgi:hypothetical protein